MKTKLIFLKYLLCIFTITEFINVDAQGKRMLLPDEKITVYTDRTLYIAGEQILFSAILCVSEQQVSISGNKGNLKKANIKVNSNFSDISYVELISSSGEKIGGGKYYIENLRSIGNLQIPKDITTGNYFLRAYTKYMRNNDPYSYGYCLLKIVNPYKKELLFPNRNDSLKIDTSLNRTSQSNISMISIDKSEYAKREKVTIQIEIPKDYDKIIYGANLTVIPEHSLKQTNIGLKDNSKIQKLDFYPEFQGVSLTGKIVDNNSNKTIPSIKVNLSIVGSERDFAAVYTDSMGRFFFSLPMFNGTRDIFLCTENARETKPKFLIDNDFCQTKVNFPSSLFNLSEEEKIAAYNLAINFQTAEVFKKQTIKTLKSTNHVAFYGNPTIVLVLDKYIQLPSIEDYINELIPYIQVKKSHGNKSFRILNTASEQFMSDPLILLDLIAIDDPNKILALPPTSIARIEVINEPYIRGNISYPGIISIFSNKDDYAGIDLPSSGVFLSYNFLTEVQPPSDVNQNSNNIPDARNTLFWNPNVILDYSKKNEISFLTSDTPGKYIIVLRGIMENGESFYSSATFTVK